MHVCLPVVGAGEGLCMLATSERERTLGEGKEEEGKGKEEKGRQRQSRDPKRHREVKLEMRNKRE